mmetsp:Transcript_13664/g.33514  ORF Transcript_13664/g.33514 Transcript_13664/m.33514 type:complete len:86 (+) Transcript_13664:1-258(+)
MASSCTSLKDNLIKCIATSKCADRGASIRECVQADDIPQDCKSLRQMFFECRRGQLDMRNRIRGNRWGGQYADSTEPSKQSSEKK